nr:immunoglobulin light chain junction region [Macaca mulatta]MOV96902.1 immunoglobulin light chain junction region [Macaca mulatta]MOW01725.1 immunoglobulin light chain junction region [Macaca mulatta]
DYYCQVFDADARVF